MHQLGKQRQWKGVGDITLVYPMVYPSMGIFARGEPVEERERGPKNLQYAYYIIPEDIASLT